MSSDLIVKGGRQKDGFACKKNMYDLAVNYPRSLCNMQQKAGTIWGEVLEKDEKSCGFFLLKTGRNVSCDWGSIKGAQHCFAGAESCHTLQLAIAKMVDIPLFTTWTLMADPLDFSNFLRLSSLIML